MWLIGKTCTERIHQFAAVACHCLVFCLFYAAIQKGKSSQTVLLKRRLVVEVVLL